MVEVGNILLNAETALLAQPDTLRGLQGGVADRNAYYVLGDSATELSWDLFRIVH